VRLKVARELLLKEWDKRLQKRVNRGGMLGAWERS